MATTTPPKHDDMKNKAHETVSNMGQQAKQATDTMGDKAKNAIDAATDKARNLTDTAADKARDLAGSARDMAGNVADRAKDAASAVGSRAENATHKVGSGMEHLADTVREKGPHSGVLGSAASSVATGLESGGRYLQEEGLKGMADDVTNLIRRNPFPAILVGIALGYVIARATSRS